MEESWEDWEKEGIGQLRMRRRRDRTSLRVGLADLRCARSTRLSWRFNVEYFSSDRCLRWAVLIVFVGAGYIEFDAVGAGTGPMITGGSSIESIVFLTWTT